MTSATFDGTVGADHFDAATETAKDIAVFRALGAGDTAIGGAGNDRFASTGGSSQDGDAGDDQFNIALTGRAGIARDTIDGGTGSDLLVIAASTNQLTAPVTAELARLAVYGAGDTTQHFVSDLFHIDMVNVEKAIVRLDGVLMAIGSFATGPAAGADSYAGTEDTVLTVDAAHGVLANDSSAGGTLHATAGTFATALGGSVTLAAGGSFTYLGAANANGADSFAYTVTDLLGHTATATAVIAVTGANDAPTATAKTGAVTEDAATSTVTGNFLTGATDPDTGTTMAVGTVNGAAATVAGTYGDLAWNATTGAYTYTLDNARAATNGLHAGQTATESFSFTVSDGSLASASQSLAITVTGANDAPTATAKTGAVTEDAATSTVTGNFLTGATDPDTGTTLAVGTVNGAAAATVAGTYGDLAWNATTGAYTYTLDNARAATNGLYAGQTATESFSFTVSDGSLASASQSLAITVTGANDGLAEINLDAVALGTGGFKIIGENDSDVAGFSVSAAGDVNGDGRADLLVGAYGNDAGGSNAGAAYVVFGKTGGTAIDLDAVALGTGGFKIIGENSSDVAGYSVSAAGDVNGDGRADLLVGAYANDAGGSNAGTAYVVFGKTSGTAIDLDAVALGTGGFKIIGENASDAAGISVSAAGDVNGDGRADLLVGAYANDAGGINAGAAYVIYGQADWAL